MCRKHLVLFFAILIFTLPIEAQNFELGKVSVSELEEKVHPKDSSAVAAVVFQKAKTKFVYNVDNGFSTVHEYQIRIKIYKKEGLSWANFEIPYYVGYENLNDESLKFSNGVTYNLENNVVVKTKLNNEGSFKKNINEYWNEATITLPNVKVGSIIEFKYVLKSENIVKFPIFRVQYDIPVNYSEYRTEIPEFFIYKPILTGYVDVKSDVKIGNGNQSYEDKNNQTTRMSYKQINTLHQAEDIPALAKEDFVDNINNYKSSVLYELEKTRFPEQPEKDYSITWEGVAKTIYESKDFGKELEEQQFLIQDLRVLLKDYEEMGLKQSDKLSIIFKFVQQKMNWNNEYGYYVDKGVKKAYIENTGNVAEINFILINMLKLAGIDANPVLVSTIEHGIPVFPNRTVFNYVIALAKIDEKQFLLDATNKFTTLNILPLHTLNWTGRLIKDDGTSREVNLVPTLSSKKNYNLLVSVDTFGKISGKFRVQKTDYEAFRFRENNALLNEEYYLEKLENELNGIEISDYIVENKYTDLSKATSETFTFSTNNHAEIIAYKMFINPLLFFTLNKNPFVKEKRVMPIYYGYPKQEKYNINFDIPEGYVVESLPKTMKINTEGNDVLFSLNCVSEGNRIQIAITIEINVAFFSTEFYNGLKDFYKQIIEKQNEKIILRKL